MMVECQCRVKTDVDFTDHILRDVLLAGIYDADIRREMYGIDKILEKPVNDVISLVEKKEMARDAHSAASAFAMSSMKEQQKKSLRNNPQKQQQQRQDEADRTKQVPCPHYKKLFSCYREGKFGWNSKPFEMCRNYYRSQKRQKPNVSSVSESQSADVGIIVANVSGIAANASERSKQQRKKSQKRNKEHKLEIVQQVPVFGWIIMSLQKVSGGAQDLWIILPGLSSSQLEGRIMQTFQDHVLRYQTTSKLWPS